MLNFLTGVRGAYQSDGHYSLIKGCDYEAIYLD